MEPKEGERGREQPENLFGDLVFRYTRAQAIADGVLVDVSAAAREAGIRFPTALTAAAWNEFIAVPEGLEGVQDEAGRLWDILWMFRQAARREPGSQLEFHVLVQNGQEGPKERTLKSVCGPGDHAEPVITIMLPRED